MRIAQTFEARTVADADAILGKLNKDHKKILKWFYNSEYFSGKDYDPELEKAAALIGYGAIVMKVHCQDLCSYGLMKEKRLSDRPPIIVLDAPPEPPGKYREYYRYHLTDEGRKIAALLRNRQPLRSIIKAPWEWVKASLSTIVIFIICRLAWDAFKPEPEEQEPPQQQIFQPATDQEP